MWLLSASLILSPVQRRAKLTVCAPEDMKICENCHVSLTSINARLFQMYLPQSLGKVVLIGTNENYLASLEKNYHESSQIDYIWKIVVNSEFTMGEIEDLFIYLSVPYDINFIVFPAWPCIDKTNILKYLYIDNSNVSTVDLGQANIIQTFFTAYFNSRRQLVEVVNKSCSMSYSVLPQTAPLYIINPFGSFTEFMVESVKFCTVSNSGFKFVQADCLISILQPSLALKCGHLFVAGHSEVNLTNILSALQARFDQVKTVSLNNIIGKMARMNRFFPNTDIQLNRFEVGYGAGIISGIHLHQMIYSGHYNKVSYFKYNHFVVFGYGNISNGEAALPEEYKEPYISYICQKMYVVFRSAGNSDPYDHSKEKQFHANATGLDFLVGYHVWLRVYYVSRQLFVYMGAIKRGSDGKLKNFYISQQGYGNPIDNNITLLVCTAGSLAELKSGKYSVPSYPFKAALYVTGFPRYIRIYLINPDNRYRSILYFNISVNIPGLYSLYLSCFKDGQQFKHFISKHMISLANFFVAADLRQGSGHCRLYVCPDSPGMDYGMEIQITDICGVSLEMEFNKQGYLFAVAIAVLLCIIFMGTMVFGSILVSD